MSGVGWGRENGEMGSIYKYNIFRGVSFKSAMIIWGLKLRVWRGEQRFRSPFVPE